MIMRLFRPFFPARWLFQEALFRMRSPEKTACLTFDDGPHPASTPELLDVLDTMNVKALFFCSGSQAEKYPELINEIKQKGHLIGNHGYSHLNGWKTSDKLYCEDIDIASQFTSDNLFRPPYGRLSISQYNHLKKIFKIVFWDIMSYDFDQGFGADRSLHLLNRKIRPGTIIVLHDTPDSTCKVFLKDFIERSVSKGYRFSLAI
ncbi:MAG: polysaccharide deacetylase family protein [Bacteroidia bacterium]|nr:polysaccharide deacetylase family protein [Bacteroidia bacterium]